MASGAGGGAPEKLWFETGEGEEVSLVEELKKLSELHTQVSKNSSEDGRARAVSPSHRVLVG